MPVLVRNRLRRPAILQTEIEHTAQRVLAAAGVPEAELSLVLVGDRRMRRLNRLYRGKDRPTDVLAFPMRDAVPTVSPLLGDVVISLPTAGRQAGVQGHSLDREVTVLLIHGVLHLLGYDHERGERAARRMHSRERAILRSLEPLPRLFREDRS